MTKYRGREGGGAEKEREKKAEEKGGRRRAIFSMIARGAIGEKKEKKGDRHPCLPQFMARR